VKRTRVIITLLIIVWGGMILSCKSIVLWGKQPIESTPYSQDLEIEGKFPLPNEFNHVFPNDKVAYTVYQENLIDCSTLKPCGIEIEFKAPLIVDRTDMTEYINENIELYINGELFDDPVPFSHYSMILEEGKTLIRVSFLANLQPGYYGTTVRYRYPDQDWREYYWEFIIIDDDIF
jgi:hypothetical protein